jgi:hypothetical protein
MSTIFCCSSIQPFKPRTLSHEPKFRTFMAWAAHPTSATVASDAPDASGVTFAIQVVKQVNYGPLESKRYFVLRGEEFVEVDEKWLVDANFEKLNTYVGIVGRMLVKTNVCVVGLKITNA